MVRDKYFTIWEEFRMYYPNIVEEVVDWYPSGRYEIVMKLENGGKLVYNTYDKTFRDLKQIDITNIDEETWSSEFGRLLKKKMAECNITAVQLSLLTGISSVSISSYIHGRSLPSVYKISKIASVLNCPVSELVEGIDVYDI